MKGTRDEHAGAGARRVGEGIDAHRLTRRSLFKAGTAAAVGATALAPSAAEAEESGSMLWGATLGAIASVDSGALRVDVEAGSRVVEVADIDEAVQQYGDGVLSQPDGATVTVSVSGSDGFWQPGHRAVLVEQYSDQGWERVGIEHLLVPIDPQEVLDREGSTLTTNEATLTITRGSEPAPEAWEEIETVPLDKIAPGDVITGLGYMSPSGDEIQVAAIGVVTGV